MTDRMLIGVIDKAMHPLVEALEPQTEELHGDGAADRYSNTAPGEIKGEDREKFGVKKPNAMGAGR